uniref:uncharacterized protein LOC120331217 n=1 Tax=Styela clava TaxID=7725 RepID=UPI00193A71CF|nr:uncharacterized protein LOC120331217 [Styela clava]
MVVHQSIDKDLRVDLCTTKEEREDFYKIAGKAFYNSAISYRYLPDKEKRKLFLPAYIRYAHEESLKQGKAILMALKKKENTSGKEIWKTVYTGLYEFDTTPTKEADDTEIKMIYREGAEAMIKRDQWLDLAVDKPIREIAANLGTVAWRLARHARNVEYKYQNYGFKYISFMTKLAYDFGLKKYTESDGSPFRIPPFHYMPYIDTFPEALQFAKKLNYVHEVVHKHYNYKSGLKCVNESKEKYEKGKYSCYYVFLHKDINPVIKEAFEKRFIKAKL